MKKRASGHYYFEIRSKRLRGGRLSLSARTGSLPVARKREAAVRFLMDRGEIDLVERLRAGDLHIADVERAFAAGDTDALRATQDGALTLRSMCDRTLRTVEATLAPASLHQYEIIADQLVAEFGADRDPSTITKAEAEAWLHRPRGAKSRPWAPKTQQTKAALAGRFWREAIEREAEAAEIARAAPRIVRNPFTGAELPEVRPTRFSWLQPEEWRTLADSVAGLPVALPLALGCLAGLRASEAIHLRPEIDVDLEARRLRIQERRGEHAWRPKNKRGEREIRIGDELLAALREHARLGYAGSRYLITTPGHDRPIYLGTLANWTRDAFEAVGLKYGREGDGLTFHSLRHTFASWLVQRDVQLMKVARLLGDTVEMVANTYGHLMPADLDRAVDLVDQVSRAEGEVES